MTGGIQHRFLITEGKRAFNVQESKDYLHRDILRPLKRKMPFYAYYIISKEWGRVHFHVHMLLNIPKEHEDYVNNFLNRSLQPLCQEDEDKKKIINYMLNKKNFIIKSDDSRLMPISYNIRVNKKHFH